MKILPLAITRLLVAVAATAAASATADADEQYAIDPSDWLSQLSCTIDGGGGGQPSLVVVADETTCASTSDGSGQSCLWCDATSTIGSGLCISSDQKSMMSQYWDQYCINTDEQQQQQQQQEQHQEVSVSVAEGDWLSQLACNVDVSGQQPSLIDENTCSSTQDANGQACVWCDASSTIGSSGGLCVSSDQKTLLGQYWDQLCSADGSSSTPPPPPPPTPPPTPPPVPAPVPAPDNNNVPTELICTMDASSNVISDETTCVGQKDTNGNACVWCDVPILGGTCITADMKSAISFLCSSSSSTTLITTAEGKYLRGDANSNDNKDTGDDGKDNDSGWKTLDPTCLGNTNGLVGDKDDCTTQTDSNGNACIWCDAGNDVFGICATMEEKEYLGTYLNCDEKAAAEEDGVDTVEVGGGVDFDALFAVE
ncbi:hypothetical protein ACHAWU_005589 [Discostella pseudostelligera]|uniref:Uncharacterized protein n=1 Tax=Discostella pseudostelligera TaxID=259834 RepID=A0ABD3N8Y5_9STRA